MSRQLRKLIMGEKASHVRLLRRGNLVFLSVAFLFLVAGCGGGTAPLSPKIEKKTVNPVQVTEKTEKGRVEEKFAYNPAGKSDPFRPFIQLTPEKEPRGYFLSQLKLVAIVKISEGNVALVEDSAGRGYLLKKGTVIGRNDGKVKQILDDKVTVEEVYEDPLGQRKVNEVSLLLHRSEKGRQES